MKCARSWLIVHVVVISCVYCLYSDDPSKNVPCILLISCSTLRARGTLGAKWGRGNPVGIRLLRGEAGRTRRGSSRKSYGFIALSLSLVLRCRREGGGGSEFVLSLGMQQSSLGPDAVLSAPHLVNMWRLSRALTIHTDGLPSPLRLTVLMCQTYASLEK